eukprot:TRINITY_DN9316_c0_g1_i1.p1 TRINITY_DN9316_c0_g1~~TRINITY_DN9316_c0_g1_i1.p1  ORF type:complete len:883 (-),score=147.83 TRINITY_DN9316_c0_g1_i1:126-2774(-)
MAPNGGSSSGRGSSRCGLRGSASVYNSQRTNEHILDALLRVQTTGKGWKSYKQSPKFVLARKQCLFPEIIKLCVDIEKSLAANDVAKCTTVLEDVWLEVGSASLKRNRESFVLLGGDALLLRILSYPFMHPPNGEVPLSVQVWTARKECLTVLRELCFTLPFYTETLAANRDFVIQLFALMGNPKTFDLAVCLAEEVLAIREDTLNVTEIPDFVNLVNSFTPRQLASFCRVLAMVVFEPEDRVSGSGFKQQKCSVVTGSALKAAEAEQTIADVNHDAILRVPKILARLVQLLQLYRIPVDRESMSSLHDHIIQHLQEVDESWWHHLIDGNPLLQQIGLTEDDPERVYLAFANAATHTVLQQWRDESLATLRARTAPTAAAQSIIGMAGVEIPVVPADSVAQVVIERTAATPRVGGTTVQPGTNTRDRAASNVLLATHQVEILFVLCALCGGRSREQVQNQLAKLGLIGVLTSMFHKLDWKTSHNQHHTRGIHGPGCACNPKSALKIQYLRLIHNFCDRDSCNRANKHLLLRSLSSPHQDVSSEATSSPKADGLIMQILRVLVAEPADSLYRFWLASCVEAFLRGADYHDQELVASTGLMEHLLSEILKTGFRCANSLQINFDLLGELIKFNEVLFRRFTKLLKGEKFYQFVEVLVTNLVDSNVFVRSVVLSLDAFKRSRQFSFHPMGWQGDTEMVIDSGPGSSSKQDSSSDLSYHSIGLSHFVNDDDETGCKLTSFVEHNSIRLLQDLMCAVRLEDINQDNICVLNTALIFLVFAEQHGRLEYYLQVLRKSDMGGSGGPGSVTRNFRSLLDFWRQYYVAKRGRDSVSLEYSTHIPFDEWLRIVDMLCAGSESSTSLLYSPTGAGPQNLVLSAASRESRHRTR